MGKPNYCSVWDDSKCPIPVRVSGWKVTFPSAPQRSIDGGDGVRDQLVKGIDV